MIDGMKKAFPWQKLLAVLMTAALFTASVPVSAYAKTVSNSSDSDVLEDDDTDNDELAPSEDEAVAGADSDDMEVNTPAKRIRLPGGIFVNMKIGETYKINYTLLPKNSDDYILYNSWNPSIAQVSADGTVTAVGYGETRIRLKTSKKVKTYVYITVEKPDNIDDDVAQEVIPDAESVEITNENVMLRKGETASVNAVLYPFGSAGKISYISSDSDVASVSSSGKITAVAEGTAIISAVLPSGAGAECTVTVYGGVYRGIDVSKWQGTIRWDQVAASGVDYAMIRSSYGSDSVDEQLAANVMGCEQNGIPYGFYHYAYAQTTAEAKQEAQFFLSTIRPYRPTYPIVLDIENSTYEKMSKKQVTAIIAAFMTELENAGYFAMTYSYANFFNDYVDMSKMDRYDIWVASWGDIDKLNSCYDYHYGMWQYSSCGSVAGINGNVDLNYAYKNYSKRIKNAGLNNI